MANPQNGNYVRQQLSLQWNWVMWYRSRFFKRRFY